MDEGRRIWSLVHSREGTSVELKEIPWWVHTAEIAGDAIMGWVCDHTDHFLCEPPDWLWDMGWGRYNWEDSAWEHSMGDFLWRFSSWVICGFGLWRRGKTVTTIPVTYEWVREHFPGAGLPWDGSDDDEMRSAPHDAGDINL
jgi:hypothetical protein